MSEDKSLLRRSIKAAVKSLSCEEKRDRALRVWSLLEENPHFVSAKCVLLFWSLPDEVETHAFVERWYGKKRILLPVVVGDSLEIREYEGADRMREGDFHIQEPTGALFSDWDMIDLAVVPGVGFDAAGNRLGRGKGYYDRLLPNLSAYKIGVCFPEQYVPSVPSDAWDVRMDEVIYGDKMENEQLIKLGKLESLLPAELGNRSLDSVFVLTDENTNRLCLGKLSGLGIPPANVICIKAGDDNKSLEALASVWKHLGERGATRKSLLINLGGGMVTDLGGFAASTFKRGMDYINVPTTLLGTIDAAVGGKTGINFGGLKNEVGVINPSKSVLIDVDFLRTLDRENFLSGFAEMIKHGLISSREVWNHILSYDLDHIDYDALPALVEESIGVKREIVRKDPTEKNIRKALNFGHTVGHAFESYAIQQNDTRLHGYAVAWGMISELYLSYKLTGFPKDEFRQAVSLIKENYGSLYITCKEYDLLYELMTHDKKNEGDGRILFTLLGGIGDIRINTSVEKKDIFESLDFYRDTLGI